MPRQSREAGPAGNKRTGGWLGYGPLARDQKTYFLYPEKWLKRQCGLLKSPRPEDGSWSRCEEADKPLCCAPGRVPQLARVTATDAAANESGDTGTFTITREGNTSGAVTVYFSLSGTATEGTDYQTVTQHSVTMAAGVTVATVTITPLSDAVTDPDETVKITLYPNPPWDYYVPIDTAFATVTIGELAAPSFLLQFRFKASPGLLVNEGTKGLALNLTENAVCGI